MINFACKQFQMEDVIRCALSLTKSDYKVFEFFMDNHDEWWTSSKVSKKLSLDTSTTQRSVKKLHEKNILQRTQSNLEGGGYLFYYKIKHKDEVADILKEIIESWVNRVKDALDKW